MNRWKKRGISIVPTIHGMSVEVIHINQAGALVNVYTDGSVLLTHGGVEMGQVWCCFSMTVMVTFSYSYIMSSFFYNFSYS